MTDIGINSTLPNNNLPRINRNDNRKDTAERDLSNANDNPDTKVDDASGISTAVFSSINS